MLLQLNGRLSSALQLNELHYTKAKLHVYKARKMNEFSTAGRN